MIISVLKNVAKIKSRDGSIFEVNLSDHIVRIPARDGTGGTTVGVFDFGKLLLNGEIPRNTSADEATSALYIIRRKWMDCPEKHLAISIIMRYLADKREERRDDAVMKLVELYGVDRAKKLSAGVRKHAFWFPAFYMREEPVAKCVVYLVDNCRGCAGACQWTPSSREAALRFVSTATNSKSAVGFRQLINSLNIAESRIRPIFDIAKYLEKIS